MPSNSGSPARPDGLLTPECAGIRRCGAPSKPPLSRMSGATGTHRHHARSGAITGFAGIPEGRNIPVRAHGRRRLESAGRHRSDADRHQGSRGGRNCRRREMGRAPKPPRLARTCPDRMRRARGTGAHASGGIKRHEEPDAACACLAVHSPNLHIFRITPATLHRLPAASWPQSRCPSRARMRRTTRRTSSRARLRCRTSWPESRAVPARCS